MIAAKGEALREQSRDKAEAIHLTKTPAGMNQWLKDNYGYEISRKRISNRLNRSGIPGGYTVLCPDMPGLVTEGRNLPEALDMAVDAASGWVLGELEEGRHEPHATNIADVKPDEPDGIVTLISLDMDAYAEKYGKKSVRKNVTIPAWLDTFGERAGINYSQVLREGLEHRYNDLQNA